jgi:hypothetical protein
MRRESHVRFCESVGVKLPHATHLIVGFQHEADARRFLDEMRTRLQEFALTLHSEKTRLIEFGRFAAKDRKQRGLGRPETFNFLGFTFICGTSRRGYFLLKRKTRRDRLRAKLKMVKEVMRRRMHTLRPPVFDRQITALDIAGLAQALAKCAQALRVARLVADITEDRQRQLLRARRNRPSRRATEKLDELAPAHHSMTSSAVASKFGGTVRPSAFAVPRLMASSNLVACSTGRSAGLAPLRMVPV